MYVMLKTKLAACGASRCPQTNTLEIDLAGPLSTGLPLERKMIVQVTTAMTGRFLFRWLILHRTIWFARNIAYSHAHHRRRACFGVTIGSVKPF